MVDVAPLVNPCRAVSRIYITTHPTPPPAGVRRLPGRRCPGSAPRVAVIVLPWRQHRMFHRIGRTVVRHPVWTIVAWLIAAVAIIATAPSLPSNSDESSFLPSSYESIKAMDLQEKAFPAAFTPAAIVLYQRTDHAALTPADKTEINRITTALGQKKIDQVQKIIDGSTSKDGKYQTALVQMDSKSQGQPK